MSDSSQIWDFETQPTIPDSFKTPKFLSLLPEKFRNSVFNTKQVQTIRFTKYHDPFLLLVYVDPKLGGDTYEEIYQWVQQLFPDLEIDDYVSTENLSNDFGGYQNVYEACHDNCFMFPDIFAGNKLVKGYELYNDEGNYQPITYQQFLEGLQKFQIKLDGQLMFIKF